MMVISMWLLITISTGSYNRGNVTVVERFPTVQECEKVRAEVRSLDINENSVSSRCIQATVFANAANVVVKP